MVFSTSAPSFDGVNVVNIVCKDDIHGIQHLLELSKSGNSTLAVTVTEKDVEFLGIVGNRLLLVDHNLTRASKAGVCYMEHNLAFSGSRHHTCQLKESDPVSDPPVTFPATVSSDDPVSDPPVTSTATVSSDGPLQVYVAVVNTGVLVILVAFGIFIYKWRDNKQVLEQQLKSFRDQIQVLEQHLKSFKDHMEEVQRNSEMRTQGRESGPMADAPPLVSLKRRPQRTSPKSFTGRNTNKPDQEDIINIKEDGKRKETDNLCSGVTSAPAVSSPTPGQMPGMPQPPPSQQHSQPAPSSYPGYPQLPQPPQPKPSAGSYLPATKFPSGYHGYAQGASGTSYPPGMAGDMPLGPRGHPQVSQAPLSSSPQLPPAGFAGYGGGGGSNQPPPLAPPPYPAVVANSAAASTAFVSSVAAAGSSSASATNHDTAEEGKRMKADNPCSDVISTPAVSSPTPALSMEDGSTPHQATKSTDIQEKPLRGACAARNDAAGSRRQTAAHGDRSVETIVSKGDGITSPQATSINIPQRPSRGAVRNHSAKDCQPTVHTNTGYGHGTGGSGGHGGGSGGGGYGGGRSVDCGVGVGNGSGGGQEGPEEQQPLLDHHTCQESNRASSQPHISSQNVHDE